MKLLVPDMLRKSSNEGGVQSSFRLADELQGILTLHTWQHFRAFG